MEKTNGLKLTELLASIQLELKAPKGQMNNFGGYKYRNLEDILEAVKPLLSGAYILLTDNIVAVGDRYYVKATATLTFGENWISTDAYARESLDKKGMDSAQITGAASSYARKYALNGLFAIDDTKDADAPVEMPTPRAHQERDPNDLPGASSPPGAITYVAGSTSPSTGSRLAEVEIVRQHQAGEAKTLFLMGTKLAEAKGVPFDSDKFKDWCKGQFKKEHFNQLSSEQVNLLIGKVSGEVNKIQTVDPEEVHIEDAFKMKE